MGNHEFRDRPGDDEGDADPGQYPERVEPPDPGLIPAEDMPPLPEKWSAPLSPEAPDPLTETAAPASLAGIPPESWIDDGRVDPPVTVTGTLDPDTGEISDLAVEGRPYIDRPGRLYMSGTYDRDSGEIVAAPPGTPGGVIPDPDRPADLGDLPFPPNEVDRGIYDGMPPPDDTLARLRTEGIEQIGRLYGVPPALLGVDPGSAAAEPGDASVADQAATWIGEQPFTGDGGRDVTELHDPGDPEQYAGVPTDDGFDDDPIERGRADA